MGLVCKLLKYVVYIIREYSKNCARYYTVSTKGHIGFGFLSIIPLSNQLFSSILIETPINFSNWYSQKQMYYFDWNVQRVQSECPFICQLHMNHSRKHLIGLFSLFRRLMCSQTTEFIWRISILCIYAIYISENKMHHIYRAFLFSMLNFIGASFHQMQRWKMTKEEYLSNRIGYYYSRNSITRLWKRTISTGPISTPGDIPY